MRNRIPRGGNSCFEEENQKVGVRELPEEVIKRTTQREWEEQGVKDVENFIKNYIIFT